MIWITFPKRKHRVKQTYFCIRHATYSTSNLTSIALFSFLKANVDIIVVFMHWGKELRPGPLPYQLRITKHLVSLGVQVIIGSHPHFLQPHCIHGNTVVAFSLGNLLFQPPRILGGNDPVSEPHPGTTLLKQEGAVQNFH